MSERERAADGARGEALAAKYYERGGYHILERNFRTRQGEIDVIVQKGNTLVFAEVKTRGERAIAQPREFVTAQKQRRLILAARRYLLLHPQWAESFLRFDVVEVILPEQGRPLLRCIENAFTL